MARDHSAVKRNGRKLTLIIAY